MVDPAVVWRDQFAFKEEIVMETPPKSAGFAAPYRLGGKGYAGSMWPTRLVTPELRDSCRPMARRQPGRSTLRTQVAAARIGGRNRCLDRESLLGDEGNVDANGNSIGCADSIGHIIGRGKSFLPTRVCSPIWRGPAASNRRGERSRVTGDCQARCRGSPGVRLPGPPDQRPSSRRNRSEQQICVPCERRRQLPDATDGQLREGLEVRFLQVEGPRPVRDQSASRESRQTDHRPVRGLRWDLRLRQDPP